MKDKENANQGDADELEEANLVSAGGRGTNSAKAYALAEKNERDRDINLVRVATENISHTTQPGGRRGSKLGNGTTPVDQSTVQAERNKSTQPQRLRKIADGLLEFERYADRKKRLQSIS